MEEREKPISIIPLLPNFCACIRLSQLTKKRRENFGVWLVVFFKQYNTYFHNTFYLHIFPQHLNNARTTLPKSVNYGNPIAKIGGKQVWIVVIQLPKIGEKKIFVVAHIKLLLLNSLSFFIVNALPWSF